jgi:hypothetical protein
MATSVTLTSSGAEFRNSLFAACRRRTRGFELNHRCSESPIANLVPGVSGSRAQHQVLGHVHGDEVEALDQ